MHSPVGASCHCGAVRLTAPRLPAWIVQCGCATCSKFGALWAYYPDGAVEVSGETETYVCNNRVIGFHRCKMCGCITHWRTLGIDFGRMAMNARPFDACDLSAIQLRVIDGPTPAVFDDQWPPAG